jgi:hypothetical protein
MRRVGRLAGTIVGQADQLRHSAAERNGAIAAL